MSGATASASTKASSGSSGPVAGVSPVLAFAKCMRAYGVHNFPDPTASGNLLLHPGAGGIDPSSPAFNAVQVKCQKLLPFPGIPSPGQATHPFNRALARTLKISQCMGSHGISWFPDPRTSVPANDGPAEYGFIADSGGAILAIPRTDITAQTGPAYYQAAGACGVSSSQDH
jgi:hypothetical protein